MNKFLYKNIYCLYYLLAKARMDWYLFKGQEEKARMIITEHMNW